MRRVALIKCAAQAASNTVKSGNSTLDITAVLPYLPQAGGAVEKTGVKRGDKTIASDKVKELTALKKTAAQQEREIIQRCREGDREAFNELVRTHQKKVFNLCFRILGNRHEAEDVAQDVFVTVFRAIKSFRGDAAFSTWVHRIAVNNCKNRLKHLRRRRYFQTESMEQTIDLGDGEVRKEFEEERESSPEEALHSSEIHEQIQDAINELEDDYRVVIVMRDVQGHSYQEISEALDLKEGTVKSRIHRARMELKRKLEHLMR